MIRTHLYSEYNWPGNIRQLSAVIERAVLLNESGNITLQDIQGELRGRQAQGVLNLEIPDEGMQFEELEKELITSALTKAGGVASKAAELRIRFDSRALQ